MEEIADAVLVGIVTGAVALEGVAGFPEVRQAVAIEILLARIGQIDREEVGCDAGIGGELIGGGDGELV